MTPNEYQKLAMTTLNKELTKDKTLLNGVMNLCGESGEAIDISKKHLMLGHDPDREHMKIVIIDGQGGRIGSLLTTRIKKENLPDAEILAIGTNSLATAAMLKAGADYGATGENPVIVACRDADFILGPIGILAADALFGEVTPAMAAAVGQSRAEKILLPVNKCSIRIAGVSDLSISALVEQAVELVKNA